MSHKISKEQHTKTMQHLVSGDVYNLEKYSHTVCVRPDKVEEWESKGYIVIDDSSDAVLVGKKIVEPVTPVEHEEV